MGNRFFAAISILALLFLSAGAAAGQPGESDKIPTRDEIRKLERNLAVTLILELAGLKESFTILTATEDFLVETQVGKGEARIELQFDGQIVFREHQLIIGDRRMESAKPILVRYRINMHGVDRQQEDGGFIFGLQGSAFLEENKEVVIARTTNMTLELRISRD
jgi:hypothetical protein